MYQSMISSLDKLLQNMMILERILGKFHAIGVEVFVGIEIEFYILSDISSLINNLCKFSKFDVDNIQLDEIQSIEHRVLSYLNSVFKHFDCKVVKEKGNNQYEIVTTPSNDIFNTILNIKRLKAWMVERAEFKISYAPKPFFGDYGNSMHINVSLYKQGLNLFDCSVLELLKMYSVSNNSTCNLYKYKIVDIICEYMCATMKDAFFIFFNTQNDLDRVSPKFMSPTHICYGYNNRTAAIRISPRDTRIEHRVANPCSNLHLSITNILISIYKSMEFILNISSILTSVKMCESPKNKFYDFRNIVQMLLNNTSNPQYNFLIFGNAFDKQYKLERLPQTLAESYKYFNIRCLKLNDKILDTE